MTFDELIAQGIRDTLEEKCAEFQPTRKKHRFSVAYKIKRGLVVHSPGKITLPSVRAINYILIAIISAFSALTGVILWRKLGISAKNGKET